MTALNLIAKDPIDLDIRPIGGRLGAEVRGIRLSGDLPAEVVAALRRALLQHKVIFLRAQGHLDDAEQERFARLLGDLVPHPTIPVRPGSASILDLDASRGGGRADRWHTDITFVDAYSQASVLRAIAVPERGGDTVWANTAAAYLDLPADLRAFAEKLWALHTNVYDYAAERKVTRAEDLQHYDQVFTSTVYETEHPVVRVHPETGERVLVLGGFAQKLIGFSKDDSVRIIDILEDHITKLENTVRWRWSVGDVAIWDNRATQHIALNDYDDQPRNVRRVSIAGDVPVSVDGRRSVTRKRPKAGAPASAAA
ncbi:MAG: TauD/TfdA family dioxygenase [Methylobacteriaceae bacterium]|nr:TauD/TfdA family dioxygenase [Methylobacteriaceae bacterium]MBV9633324.1 TauD/TfdA family dioxygenase [Methylobacteriaceae bacterium]